jgi:5'-deoxynucleotidase YfbR-like HD superfamily hydrolase
MTEKIIHQIEQHAVSRSETNRQSTASIALELGSIAMQFARIERVPRYDEKTRESDAEHSFMLALVANELAHNLYPNELDNGKIMGYAIVHDLIELETGDVATFQLDDSALIKKEAIEQAALENILAKLPLHTRGMLYNYEQQNDKESRFVRAVDKLLPIIVDILGSGKKVMIEDYSVVTASELTHAYNILRARMKERFSEFPQIVTDHALLCELFEIYFSPTG